MSAQLRIHVDFDARMVLVASRGALDIEATVIPVPFAVWKATASQVLKSEAEDELTMMVEGGQLVATADPGAPKIEVVGSDAVPD